MPDRFRISPLLWAAMLAGGVLVLVMPRLLLEFHGVSTVGPIAGAVLLLCFPLWGIGIVVFVLDIDNEGLVLYRLHRLAWVDIVAAREQRILGLSYLVVQRRSGMSWWLPLYFIGAGSVCNALRRHAPPSNPLIRALA